MPNNNKKLTFENWQKTQLNPFVVYAYVKAIDVASYGAGENNNPNTIEDERQNPANFGAIMFNSNCKYFNSLSNPKHGFSELLFLKSIHGLVHSKFCANFVSAIPMEKPAYHRGADCISKLLQTLRSWLKCVYSEKQTFRCLQLSAADRQKQLSPITIICCISGDSVNQLEILIHHRHLTVNSFGVVHSSCNLKARPNNLPKFFQNLSR